ncbi:MAG: RNA methyltransferase [Candidatus Bipolaricaulota bacterium]|nr:RNA methyltransferase [Candidatus Bipolaricaulota bacterium]
MANLYVGLLHYPMRNREGDIVATSVTSLDIHDIARSARTYGVARYFVITPVPTQQAIAERVHSFWTDAERIDDKSRRGEAIEYVVVASDLDETLEFIEKAEGRAPFVVATSARPSPKNRIGFDELRLRLRTDAQPVYILFGTGWGMADELIDACDAILPSIMPDADFNHLSVRAAVAIVLDRVAGDGVPPDGGCPLVGE